MAGYPSNYGSSAGFGSPAPASAIPSGDGGVPSSHMTAQQIKNFVSGVKDSVKFKEGLSEREQEGHGVG